jgi:hypothetical protein
MALAIDNRESLDVKTNVTIGYSYLTNKGRADPLLRTHLAGPNNGVHLRNLRRNLANHAGSACRATQRWRRDPRGTRSATMPISIAQSEFLRFCGKLIDRRFPFSIVLLLELEQVSNPDPSVGTHHAIRELSRLEKCDNIRTGNV